jgi:glucan endo-1,3-alpha-glucosidase
MQQLNFAYAAAQSVGFKVFISFDFSIWGNGDVSTIASYMKTYSAMPAQFQFNGKPFVSSFIGDGFPWRQVESQSVPLFACPFWQAASLAGNDKYVQIVILVSRC